MDFALTPEQHAFRQEIRAFLAQELAHETVVEDGWIAGFSLEFSRKLGAHGWIGLTWPKKHGGQEKTYLDRVILTEELLRAGRRNCCNKGRQGDDVNQKPSRMHDRLLT